MLISALLTCSCGGGGSGTAATNQQATIANPGQIETGAAAKIVRLTAGSPATVALFPDGKTYFSPDGFNLGGGGASVVGYSGSSRIIDIIPLRGGIEALLSDGSAYFSADGMNLGGGGKTVAAYTGTSMVQSLTAVGPGIDAVLAGSGTGASGVFFSPDGLNLGGGGNTISIYNGASGVSQIVSVGTADAVVALLANGTAYYSPDNRNLGGGGGTVAAAPGSQAAIVKLVKVAGAVLTQFDNGAVYRSPDGQHLDGGGSTIAVAAWNTTIPNGPFGPRDSAPGVNFLGHLWLSGGFALATNSDSCFATCSQFNLWSSVDLSGVTWNSTPTFATATTPDPRDVDPTTDNGIADVAAPTDFYDAYAPVVVWNGALTAIGATVWRSADGSHWARQNLPDGVTAVTGPAPIRATENSRAIVLNGTLFFLQAESGEVHSTTDPNAATWTDLGAIPGFAGRCGPIVFALNGKIWVEGGGACDYSAVYHDVWSSTNGIDWTQSTTDAQWSARMWSCVADSGTGIIWLASGYAPTDYNNASAVTVRYGANHSDVWYTRDGANWSQLKADMGSGLPDDGAFEPRHAPTCFVVGNTATTRQLLVVGGSGTTVPDATNERVQNSIRELPLPATTGLP